MMQKQQQQNERQDPTVVLIAKATNARGMQAQDYELPSLAEVEAELKVRLEKMLASDAVDIETIAVFEERILAAEKGANDALDVQRTRHEGACSGIVQLAEANLAEASGRLKDEKRALRAAVELHRQQREKLARHDPDSHQRV
jgi:hypothetical protein